MFSACLIKVQFTFETATVLLLLAGEGVEARKPPVSAVLTAPHQFCLFLTIDDPYTAVCSQAAL